MISARVFTFIALCYFSDANPAVISHTPPSTSSLLHFNVAFGANSTCLPHIIDLTQYLDYASFVVPVIIDRIPDWATKDEQAFQEMKMYARHRINIFGKITLLRSFQCVLQLIIAPSYAAITQSESSEDVLRIMLSHRFIFHHLNQNNYGNGNEVILPENVLIVSVGTSDNLVADYSSRLLGIIERLYITSSHTPLTFVLTIGQHSELEGLFVCWYCGERQFFRFTCENQAVCSTQIQIVHKEAIDFGKNVQWILLDDANLADVKKTKYIAGSPCFGAHQDSSCILFTELEFVANFIFANLNTSILIGDTDCGIFDGLQYPNAAKKRGQPKGDVVSSSFTTEFRFITSDSVTEVEEIDASYWSWYVWLLIGISLSMSCLVMVIDYPFLLTLRNYLPLAFRLASHLIDQGGLLNFFEKTKRRIATTRRGHVGVRHWTVLMNWLLVSTFLTYCFKAAFQANHFTEKQYVTKWKSLLEFQNFTVFIGYDKYPFDPPYYESNATEDDYDYAWLGRCVVRNTSISDGRNPCILADQTTNVAVPPRGASSTRESVARVHRDALWELTRQLKLINMKSLPLVIKNELTKPQTLFLSPVHRFANDWEIFRKTMKSLKRKFVSNIREEDNFLRTVDQYTHSRGLNSYHMKTVPASLKALMSSGIYDFWKKWEHNDHVPSIRQLKLDLPVASLLESDIYNVFYMYLFCIGIAVATSVIQFSYSTVMNFR